MSVSEFGQELRHPTLVLGGNYGQLIRGGALRKWENWLRIFLASSEVQGVAICVCLSLWVSRALEHQILHLSL